MNDLIDSSVKFPFHERVLYGPGFSTPQSERAPAIRMKAFRHEIDAPNNRRLIDWWTAKLVTTGHIPPRDRNWIVELSDIVGSCCLLERVPDDIRLRFRYFGERVVARSGVDMTGRDLTDYNGQTVKATWDLWRPLFEEGRPAFACLDLRQLAGKGYLKLKLAAVPLRDGDSGGIRHAIFALDLHSAADPLQTSPG